MNRLEGLRKPRDDWGIYVHIPYCASRCGYCDFNTYAPDQLAPDSQPEYVAALIGEIRDAARWLGGTPPAASIFFGGGTPTLLPVSALRQIVAALREAFPIAPGAEITTEANPETLSAPYLAGLLEAGFNRISIGMQSATPHVLRTLERTHTPGRAVAAAHEAAAAGFSEINLDLIYGTAGESLADWKQSVAAALSAPLTHLSAYSLIVEDGTRLARQVRAGDVGAPDPDDLAEKYWLADAMAAARGLRNYETSNWAIPGSECRHNLAYWRSADWWGFGAGAHSHVRGVRWHNVKHPLRYQQSDRIANVEAVTAAEAHLERVMLGLRLPEGVAESELSPSELARIPQFAGNLLWQGGRVSIRPDARLLADAIIRDLLD